MSFIHVLKLLTILHSFIIFSNALVVKRSPVTLELSRLVNAEGMHNLVAHDRARAKALRGSTSSSEPVINIGVSYIAMVGVGSPPTEYRLIVDTGSSNTWVGANTPYVPTSTSEQTPNTVSVTYGSGSFSGNEYIDQVTLTPSLVIPKQSIGVASTSTGFNSVDGILGIGPVDLTIGTLSPDTEASIPTVTDNLFEQGTIPANEVGVYFAPTLSPDEEPTGQLDWGCVDDSKIEGEITYARLTSTPPAKHYWGVDQTITYGGATVLSTTAGIVDTGTTLILLATDAFQEYAKLTGGTPDSATGLLSITPDQYANLKNLNFIVRDETFELTPNAQIWPRVLNTAIGGKADAIYLIVADIGANSGSGLDFINGMAFLQRFYTVYDTANRRVGFARTPHTTDTTN